MVQKNTAKEEKQIKAMQKQNMEEIIKLYITNFGYNVNIGVKRLKIYMNRINESYNKLQQQEIKSIYEKILNDFIKQKKAELKYLNITNNSAVANELILKGGNIALKYYIETDGGNGEIKYAYFDKQKNGYRVYIDFNGSNTGAPVIEKILESMFIKESIRNGYIYFLN